LEFGDGFGLSDYDSKVTFSDWRVLDMAKFIVLATAGFFLLYGLAFAFVPEQFSLLVTQSAPQSPSGLIEFRATFGCIGDLCPQS